jgi:hypothetical protein
MLLLNAVVLVGLFWSTSHSILLLHYTTHASLSIFMGLIFFRGLAWQYTAETIAILVVEIIMGILVQKASMTTQMAVFVLCIFPLSIVLVATLEHFGLD